MSHQPGSGIPSYQQPKYGAPVKQGLAVASLVLGIISVTTCVYPLGLIAIILGIVALSLVSSDPGRHGGRGLAIGGIVCGGVSLVVMLPLLFSVFLPSFSRGRELSKRRVCAANMRAIDTAVKRYAADPSMTGEDILLALVERGDLTAKTLVCPAADLESDVHAPETSYVVVRLRDPEHAGDRDVIMYEPKSNHGGEGGTFLFADGHVEFVEVPEYDELIAQIESRESADKEHQESDARDGDE